MPTRRSWGAAGATDMAGWFKLFDEVRHDGKLKRIASRIGVAPATARGLWLDLLCFTHELDQDWRLQLTAKAPLSVADIADELGADRDAAERFICECAALGMLTQTRGGAYLVTNGEKRQAKPSDSPAATRERKQRQRQREQGEASRPVTRDTSRHTDEEVEEEVEERNPFVQQAAPDHYDFKSFWTAYPRREHRTAAEVAWATLTASERADAIKVADQMLKAVARKIVAREYVPLPGKWLNERRWEDWADGPPPGWQPKVRPIRGSNFERIARELEAEDAFDGARAMLAAEKAPMGGPFGLLRAPVDGDAIDGECAEITHDLAADEPAVVDVAPSDGAAWGDHESGPRLLDALEVAP